MPTFDVLILLPFEDWAVKADNADDAIRFIRETDFPLQIHPESLHHMVAKETDKGLYKVSLLSPLAGNRIEDAENEADAYNKSAMRSFIQKGVPYAIAINNKVVKTVV